MNDFSDDILIEASRRGDKSAYALLVKRHYHYVFALCLGLLGDFHDSEDITQETFLRGFSKIRGLGRNERFSRWILQIARHISFDFLRRRKLSKEALASLAMSSDANAGHRTVDLEGAIRQLPKELRVPLVMYYFDNQDTKAIAEKIGISHSGVCRRLRTARRELHELLVKEVQNEESM